jgi:hypothetical protein
MDSETIETRGKYRVRLERDEHADAPYFYAGSPVVNVYYGRCGVEVSQTESVDYSVPSEILAALERWGWNESHLFERYVRTFFGASQVVWFYGSQQGDHYVSFDTAEWRAKYEVPENAVDVTEYQAWLDGDVYGYVVEEHVIWQRLGSDGEPVFLTDEPTRETWEHVDSCYGYYGREYAEERARKALTEEAGEED